MKKTPLGIKLISFYEIIFLPSFMFCICKSTIITHPVQFLIYPFGILVGTISFISGIFTFLMTKFGRVISIIVSILTTFFTVPFFPRNIKVVFSSLNLLESPFELAIVFLTIFSIFTIYYLTRSKVREQFIIKSGSIGEKSLKGRRKKELLCIMFSFICLFFLVYSLLAKDNYKIKQGRIEFLYQQKEISTEQYAILKTKHSFLKTLLNPMGIWHWKDVLE